MYAKYVSKTTSVQAQVINDLALLLSGSPISALSASCDKVNTTLLSTVAPGWTIVDDAAPSSGCVLSAPDADGLTTKYVNLNIFSAVLIGLTGYEAWNSVAHTGTNAAVSVANSCVSYSATVATTIIIFATPRSFYLTNVVGNYGVGAFEFTRECNYLVGTTYPCFAILGSFGINGLSAQGKSAGGDPALTLNGVPRSKNLVGAGDLTGAASGVAIASLAAKTNTMYTSNNGTVYICVSNVSPPKLFDAAGLPYYELRPIWAMSSAGGAASGGGVTSNGAIIGKFYDILETSWGIGNNLDTFSDGTNTYVFLGMSGGSGAYAFKLA